MSYHITATAKFRKELKKLSKKYHSLAIEYTNLIDNLEDNPNFGTALGNDCYKIRLSIASKNKGKSGGARVITYVYVTDETVFLLSIYDKSKQASITKEEIMALIEDIGL